MFPEYPKKQLPLLFVLLTMHHRQIQSQEDGKSLLNNFNSLHVYSATWNRRKQVLSVIKDFPHLQSGNEFKNEEVPSFKNKIWRKLAY